VEVTIVTCVHGHHSPWGGSDFTEYAAVKAAGPDMGLGGL